MRKTVADIGEEGLIADYFAPLVRHPGALGLQDDAAVLAPPAGCDLVITKDAVIGGEHFFHDDPPDAIARKALRVNLSDLAAKGAAPTGFLLALAVPERTPADWLRDFAEALGADADGYGCPLLGGDTVKSPRPVMVSITAFGLVPHGKMVQRRGARAGDRVIVTGTIGDAALGLAVRRVGKDFARGFGLTRDMRRHLLDRYLEPQPRMAAAPALQLHASASMDVSDGLAGDLAKLSRVSRVSAEIEVARVPLSAAARQALSAQPSFVGTVLAGGDDYEILCTVPEPQAGSFIAAVEAAGVSATEIGRITAGAEPPRFLAADGQPLHLDKYSFSHF